MMKMTKIISVVLLSLLIAACGGDGVNVVFNKAGGKVSFTSSQLYGTGHVLSGITATGSLSFNPF